MKAFAFDLRRNIPVNFRQNGKAIIYELNNFVLRNFLLPRIEMSRLPRKTSLYNMPSCVNWLCL